MKAKISKDVEWTKTRDQVLRTLWSYGLNYTVNETERHISVYGFDELDELSRSLYLERLKGIDGVTVEE